MRRSWILWILMGVVIWSYSAKAMEQSNFQDVPQDHWAYTAIHAFQAKNIIQGTGDQTFGLGKTIKRAEFMAFLVRILELDTIQPVKGSFIDNQNTKAWYYAIVETALLHNLIEKNTQNARPLEDITREEMAEMLVRAVGLSDLAKTMDKAPKPFADVDQNVGFITIVRDLGIVSGRGNDQFQPKATAKREEAVTMLMRMEEKRTQKLEELHGFYALQSYGQRELIQELDSVSFGWSRLQYDDKTQKVFLNMTRTNNDMWLPDGFEEPIQMAQQKGITTQLNIFASDQDRVTFSNEKTGLVSYILSDAKVRHQVIQDIVAKANETRQGSQQVAFDGVVIDFENMKGTILAEQFNTFLKELKSALGVYRKQLYVAVHPKGKPGQIYFDGYDYKAIGEIADRVILMAHDYGAKSLTNAEAEAGYTLTPLTPFDEIYYALRSITDPSNGVQDPSKVWLQISFDSIQWKLQDEKVIRTQRYNPTYGDIYMRLRSNDPNANMLVQFSQSLQNPCITYYNATDGTYNVIWYEDSRSVNAKLHLARLFGIGGISLWRLGNIPQYEESHETPVYMDVWQKIVEQIS